MVHFTNKPRELSLGLQGIALLFATYQKMSKTGFLLGLQIIQGLEITDANTMECYFNSFSSRVTATRREIMI